MTWVSAPRMRLALWTRTLAGADTSQDAHQGASRCQSFDFGPPW